MQATWCLISWFQSSLPFPPMQSGRYSQIATTTDGRTVTIEDAANHQSVDIACTSMGYKVHMPKWQVILPRPLTPDNTKLFQGWGDRFSLVRTVSRFSVQSWGKRSNTQEMKPVQQMQDLTNELSSIHRKRIRHVICPRYKSEVQEGTKIALQDSTLWPYFRYKKSYSYSHAC